MNFFVKPSEANVIVVESSVALRSVVIEALRSQGFSKITGFGDLKTMFDYSTENPIDWILTAAFRDDKFNIFHCLNFCIIEPRLMHTRVSLLQRDQERDLLPFAFELGLLSFHYTVIPSRIAEEIAGLNRCLKLNHFNEALTSSAYLIKVLKEGRYWSEIVDFERKMLGIFPGSTQIMLALAEAQLQLNQRCAHTTLDQILIVDSSLQDKVDYLRGQFPQISGTELALDSEESSTVAVINGLGIGSCAVIDPDTSVHHLLEQSLKSFGLNTVDCFDSGLSFWQWLLDGALPDLIIMEWRIPDLQGMQLIQRIRQEHPGLPIVLATSLLGPSDLPLLREFGVNGFMLKPFESESILSEIINVLQQSRYPTEQAAMDRAIRQCLQLAQSEKASCLIAAYLLNPSFDQLGKLKIEAEFAFYNGKFRQCCQLSLEALKTTGENVELINLLGKSLMKLGDFASAFRLFEKANIIAPKNIERVCNMAQTCLDLGQTGKAQEFYEQAAQIDDKNILVIETSASIGIALGESDRTRRAMESLGNLQKIISITNNKAIAKIHENQIEEAVKFYNTALAALPLPWGFLQDTICYNLALAYIRFADYPLAKSYLIRIKAEPGSVFGSKRDLLLPNLELAIKTNSVLNFKLKAKDVADEKVEVPIDLEPIIDALVPRQGDVCCYRIFSSRDLIDSETRNLLANMPKLRKRPTSRRTS